MTTTIKETKAKKKNLQQLNPHHDRIYHSAGEVPNLQPTNCNTATPS